MKTVVLTLSIGNAAMGLFLAGLYLLTEGNPLIVVGLATALLLQGGYTLAYLSGSLRGGEPWPNRIMIAGSTFALLVGVGGLLMSITDNLLRLPPGAEAEYGPMFVAGLFTAHAIAALFAFAVTPDTSLRSPASGRNSLGS